MKNIKKLTLAALIGLTLSGCSMFEKDEDELPELPVIQAQFQPKIQWQEQVGDGVEEYFSRLRPVIHEGMVYAASREGIVSAFDFASGKEAWSVDLRDAPESFFAERLSQRLAGGLTVAYNKLYVGSENGEVIALDIKTGKELWRQKVKGEVIAPVASGDGLIFANTTAGYLMALHPDTGEIRWEYEQEVPPLTLRGIGTPIVDNGGVIFGSANGKLNVIISQSGLEAWKQSVATPVGASELERLVDVDTRPVLINGTIYAVAYNGNLVAFDMQSGRIKWKKEYSSYRNIAYDALVIYLTDAQDHIHAINANTGIELWHQDVLARRGVTGVYADGEQLVVGDSLGYLHWLNKKSGELVSRLELDSSGLFVSAIGDKNEIVVMTRDGELSAIKAP